MTVPVGAPPASGGRAGGGAFGARALAARERYNAVLGRALAHGADRGTLAGAVHEVAAAVEPLADQLAADAFAATCDALVDVVARVVTARRWRRAGRDVETTGGTAERSAVLDVVPRLAPWLTVAPAVTVAAVVDGARAVGGGPGAGGDTAAWAARVVAAARATTGGTPGGEGGATHDPASPASVRAAVLVAAWRSGLVRYRRAALDAARSLPGPVARAALSLAPSSTGELRDVLDRHVADPWWWPEGGTTEEPGPWASAGVHVLGRFGGFRGFGGPWLTPPRVVGPDPRRPGLGWALRTDGPDGPAPAWTLVADVHGSVVARAHGPVGEPGRPPLPALAGLLDDVTAAACVDSPSGRLTLLSRARSYDVLLVREAR